MKYLSIPLLAVWCLLAGCSHEEASEYERTEGTFVNNLGGSISPQQWWETAVTLKIDIVTDELVKLWLYSSQQDATLYDYKEIDTSGTINMTAPQGMDDKFQLTYLVNGKYTSIDVTLSGKREETITIDATPQETKARSKRAPKESLSGSSVIGSLDPRLSAQYYEFEMGQLMDFFSMMNISRISTNAKELGLNCNYELVSNGPFTITWVNGYEADQTSHILGYYYHTPGTYSDIKYVDLSETHKWDYIDGLAKVQYKLVQDITTKDGLEFKAEKWYDANFDIADGYNSKSARNMDRIGDNAFNMQAVFNEYKDIISALRGISFDVDVPVGMHIGFYLRSDEEPQPTQWQRLGQLGVSPYTKYQYQFMGTCFSAEALNIDGTHRSFIMDDNEVIWMGMEDIVDGGDYDCNDVIFGVVTKIDINYMPDITTPDFFSMQKYDPFPWTLAFEDVNRQPDFDFNDAVIKLLPDYENEQCCVTVMAAGSEARMYLHYDGPDGDQNLGEIHELLEQSKLEPVNTTSLIASTPFVQIDCVPWPRSYTMSQDARRFYIEIQRGTCQDCTDIIALPSEPGQMPEALLVAGEWKWPKEGTHIFAAYKDFPQWSKDVTRTRYWGWYQSLTPDTYVSY